MRTMQGLMDGMGLDEIIDALKQDEQKEVRFSLWIVPIQSTKLKYSSDGFSAAAS